MKSLIDHAPLSSCEKPGKYINQGTSLMICAVEARQAVVISAACLLLLTVSICRCSAQYMDVAPEGCSEQSGIFAYRIVGKNLYQICVAKAASNTVQLLFTKTLSRGVAPPICVSNAIVVVGYDGSITKYGLDGKEVFSKKMLEVDEVSMLSGRWDTRTIYMTTMKYEGSGSGRKPRYKCLCVDVQGREAVRRWEIEICQPRKLFRIENDIVVCGPTDCERKPAPEGIKGR